MKQIEVQIMDQSYLLGCPEGGEARLLDAVEKVDTAMCRIRDAAKVKARDRIAVLAALNLAFDLSDQRAQSAATPAGAVTAGTPTGALAATAPDAGRAVLAPPADDPKLAQLVERWPCPSLLGRYAGRPHRDGAGGPGSEDCTLNPGRRSPKISRPGRPRRPAAADTRSTRLPCSRGDLP